MFSHHGFSHLVFEYVEGLTLDDDALAEDGPFHPAALPAGMQMAAAMGHVHGLLPHPGGSADAPEEDRLWPDWATGRWQASTMARPPLVPRPA